MKSGRFEISDPSNSNDEYGDSNFPCLQGRKNKMISASVCVLLSTLIIALLIWFFFSVGSKEKLPDPSKQNTIVTTPVEKGNGQTETWTTTRNLAKEKDGKDDSCEKHHSHVNRDTKPNVCKPIQCEVGLTEFLLNTTEGEITEEICKKHNCCWVQGNEKASVPRCFYPKGYAIYKHENLKESTNKYEADIILTGKSPFGNDLNQLKFIAVLETDYMLHVKVFDPNNKRYESPFPVINNNRTSPVSNPLFEVKIDNTLGFQVVRKKGGEVVFDTRGVGGFIFSDQLIQFTARLPSKYIYGLGHQKNDFFLRTDWERITLFNRDTPPTDKVNLYSSHPFYMIMENDGSSHGFFLLNSNALEIVLQPKPAITFRTIGGILDMYFFLGPSPSNVVEQYTDLIGRPQVPPYWSLGFHLSRLGYKNVTDTNTTLYNNIKLGIRVDTQWHDLDYMKNRNIFTYDDVNFKDLPHFVEKLQEERRHYVMLIDPGISAGEENGTYLPYDEGLQKKVFVMDDKGENPFICQVWNRSNRTVFPDFMNPTTFKYWKDQLAKQYYEQFKFDGVWLDMNEPTNFINGSVGQDCPDNNLENPPYVPNVFGKKLSNRTVCMSALHFNKTPHYNVHNIYGLAQTIATEEAMTTIKEGKRAFIITRATFPGVGHYAGTWTGDVFSTWDDMKHSIADILSFSIFGIPMVGADICGFNGDTTVALCERWSQLGAFYPFSRNHNSDDTMKQDPAFLGEKVVKSAKKSLETRYSLLPYLYSLFYEAKLKGSTVVRPLFFEFPTDKNTYTINKSFLWGSALLIVPVLEEGKTEVETYLPKGVWYDYYNKTELMKSKGTNHKLQAEFETIPLLLRGGNIIPTQQTAAILTQESLQESIDLLVILNEDSTANGNMYWDDGEQNGNQYNKVEFNVLNSTIESKPANWYDDNQPLLGSVTVLGLQTSTPKVTLNGTIDVPEINFSNKTKVLHIQLQNYFVTYKYRFSIEWNVTSENPAAK